MTRRHWPPRYVDPRTESTDYPTDQSIPSTLTDTLYGPSQNRIKNSLTGCLIDCSCERKFERHLVPECNRSWSSLGRKIYHYTYCHFLCCGYNAYERRGSLREASIFVRHFVHLILLWVCELLPGFKKLPLFAVGISLSQKQSLRILKAQVCLH